jgi:subtilisin family serine protease
VATVTITPDSSDVTVGGTVQLAATAKAANGTTITGRQASWSSSDASLASVSNAGVVTTILPGRVVVTATIDGKSGSAVVRALAQYDSLPGAPGGPAVTAIPPTVYVPQASDYMPNADLGGMSMSFNSVVVTITSDATLAQLNALLKDFRAQVVGGMAGVAGTADGIVVLRLSTRTHQEAAAVVTAMTQRTIVANVFADALLQPLVVSRIGDPALTPLYWSWSVPGPDGSVPAVDGNWGLEAIRVPQLWNLNRTLPQGDRHVTTAVFDDGFALHRDLIYNGNPTVFDMFGFGPAHGTHVAGTIGATVDNGIGVDGVSPFARLVIRGFRSTGGFVTGLANFITDHPTTRVVNVSLGYNPFGMNTASNPIAQAFVNSGGRAMKTALQAMVASGKELPVIVAAAGNESADGNGLQPAAYGSPFNNAALIQGVASIIVVEAVGQTPTGVFFRAPFSNIGGHVSAPGLDIMSTVLSDGYGFMHGTSMASPHVAGLVSYLYSLAPDLPAPTLTSNPIRELLVASSVPVFEAAGMVDAFAAALRVDVVRGGDAVLRKLLDIDDGTKDGNTRRAADGTEVTDDDVDGNGLDGDGTIDMSDFRRFRDALLQTEDDPLLSLDGAANHPKRDLNRSGDVREPAREGLLYPRADFNGDNKVHRTATRALAGVLQGQTLTDLQVLQSRFDDPHYDKTILPTLLNSGDVTVDASACLSIANVQNVRTRAVLKSDPGVIVEERVHNAADGVQYMTLPVNPGGYQVVVAARDAGGTVLAQSAPSEPLVTLGGDWHLTPQCDVVDLSVIFPLQVATGVANQLNIRAGEKNLGTGIITYRAGIQISISVTGGSVANASGVTNSTGHFITTGSLSAGSTSMTINVTAAITNGASRRKTVSATRLINPLAISGNLTTGFVNTPYDRTLTATGGIGGYQWSVTLGTLPNGLLLDGSSGRIHGIPTTVGNFSFTVTVTSGTQSASGAFNVRIDPEEFRYDGLYNDGDGVQTPRTLYVYPIASGNTCFMLMFIGQTLHPGGCQGGIASWQGTISGGTITATSIYPGNKPMSGTISATSVSFSSTDAFGRPVSFSGTRVP